MLEDRRLINRLKRGEKEALRRLYEKYKDNLLAVAALLLNERAAAEDAVHDVFVSFADVIGGLKFYGSVRSYLMICVVNRVRDRIGRKKFEVVEVDRTGMISPNGGPAEGPAVLSEEYRLLIEVLARIPFEQREAIILQLQGGMRFREIALVQGVPVSTAQGRYRHGLAKLRSLLVGEQVRMKPLEPVENSIAQIRVGMGKSVDERILVDCFAALESSMSGERARTKGVNWLSILTNPVTVVLAAGMVIIGALYAVDPIVSREPARAGRSLSRKSVSEQESERIVGMLAARDIGGLVRMLWDGQFDSQVLAAICLGEIGDERALPALDRLYLAAQRRPPDGYVKNPFAGPIEKIKQRIRASGPEVARDANEAGRAEANEATAEASDPEAGVVDLLVVDKRTQEPLAGVELDIAVERNGPDQRQQGSTDEQGRCRVEIGRPEPTYVRLRAKAAGFVPMEVELSRSHAGADIPAQYTLSLEPGTAIGGFVVDEQGGLVEGASVFLRVPEGAIGAGMGIWILDHEVRTDANGFWRCDVMPAELEDVEIRLAHPEYVDDEYYGAGASIEQLRGMTATMVMKQGIGVYGRVLDSSGRPIENATVAQGSDHRGAYYPSTKTDAEGRFEFTSARPGEMVLTVQAEGFSPDLKETLVVENTGPIEFRLAPGHTIHGQVIDTEYNPVVWASVHISEWRGHRSLEWQTYTDDEGRFEWRDGPADEIRLFIGKLNFRSIPDFAAMASDEEYMIVMAPPLRIIGTVVDADSNEPLKDFLVVPGVKSSTDGQVSWRHRNTTKYVNGAYDFKFCCPEDGLIIRIEAEGYVPRISRPFSADEGNVLLDFALEKGPKPSGIVYLANGEPAGAVELAICTISQKAQVHNGRLLHGPDLQIVKTGLDGWFSFPSQFEPYLLVAVGEQGYAQLGAKQVEADGQIVLDPWGSVEGLVLVGPVPGAEEMVSLRYYEPQTPNVPSVSYYNQATTDSDGAFVMDRVVPGRAKVGLEIELSASDTVFSHAELVEISPGETARVTIGGRGIAVQGSVVVPEDYNEPVDWSNALGSVSLRLRRPSRPRGLDQLSGEEKRSWQQLWQESEQGKAYEQFRWEQARSYMVKIGPDGVFRVEDVPAGAYDLQMELHAELGEEPFDLGQIVGSLHYKFEIMDLDVKSQDAPVDLGTLRMKIRKRVTIDDDGGLF